MIILGINAHHADAAAAIVVDGKLVAACEEERFRRIKHWAGFRQVKLRSRRRVEWLFQIAAAAYNLVRMTRLRPALT